MSLNDFKLPPKPWTIPSVPPLLRYHLDILRTLSEQGPSKAMFFDEDDLDYVFKIRPKLIRLCPGHQDAVIEITVEGRKRLVEAWVS